MTEREYNRVKAANYRLGNRERVNAGKRAWYARNAETVNARRREARKA